MDLKIGNFKYVSNGKLDAFTQLHIARKLGPAFPMVEGLVDKENLSKDKTLLMVVALSRLNDADTEYVVKKSLGVVSRIGSDGQPFIIQTREGHLMFDDLVLSDILKITIEVLEENLGDFFRGALSALTQKEA